MKAYNYNGVLYKSRDLAILCNGTNKNIVEVQVDKRVPLVRGDVEIFVNKDKTIDFDLIVDDLYITWHEGIQFKFDFHKWEDNFEESFEQMYVSGDFEYTDLSQSLINKINHILESYYSDWLVEEKNSMRDYMDDLNYDAMRENN